MIHSTRHLTVSSDLFPSNPSFCRTKLHNLLHRFMVPVPTTHRPLGTAPPRTCYIILKETTKRGLKQSAQSAYSQTGQERRFQRSPLTRRLRQSQSSPSGPHRNVRLATLLPRSLSGDAGTMDRWDWDQTTLGSPLGYGVCLEWTSPRSLVEVCTTCSLTKMGRQVYLSCHSTPKIQDYMRRFCPTAATEMALLGVRQNP